MYLDNLQCALYKYYIAKCLKNNIIKSLRILLCLREREREGGVMKGRREKASVLSDFIFFLSIIKTFFFKSSPDLLPFLIFMQKWFYIYLYTCQNLVRIWHDNQSMMKKNCLHVHFNMAFKKKNL